MLACQQPESIATTSPARRIIRRRQSYQPPTTGEPEASGFEYEGAEKHSTRAGNRHFEGPTVLDDAKLFDDGEAENIPPLTSGDKVQGGGTVLIDPSEFVLIGFVAGLGQASNSNPSYGQGAQGYGKRYATAYADNAIENFMASAALPSLASSGSRVTTNWVTADFSGAPAMRSAESC